MDEATHEAKPGLGGLPEVMADLVGAVAAAAADLADKRRQPSPPLAVGA
jgi:hypothetical protein